ncbi:T9SS type A sorting domain-containing protein [Hymenobacter taeanensis]|uniref:T9SS type A sorting domain-containing protein n=1 Tax=Hymenobacter taeanensis TaxID=2735321 RepID=A0A6M6BFG4_9BACT|nr:MULTISPECIES: T9SS type A sorting domain-containing protein [Hymenobacter]QJX45895.1 T9SS type A sorting domain-containing protein [Hymenobacter taeanensis]UOQ79742.1 T9SS type A sorting domain-containing protein [Hymenobacter sp. 5414T-23]
MKIVFCIAFIAGMTTQSFAQTTYRWVGGVGNGSSANGWTVASNWLSVSPQAGLIRSTPAATDILIFDGLTSPTQAALVDFNNETIGQLRLINNVTLTLEAPSTGNGSGTLSINNPAAGDDFIISAGSTINYSSSASTTNRYITISLAPGSTGLIEGTVNLNGNTNGSPLAQRLIAASANAIQVQNNATIIAQNIIGHPFGTTASIPTGNNNTNSDVSSTAGSVVFNAGSTFQHLTGNDAFGTGTNPVAVFRNGSTYRYSGGVFSSVGQQYGNLQLLAAATVAGSNMTILNDLTVTGVTANLNSLSTTIGGNVFVNSNATPTAGILNFTPASAANITFNGTSAQSVGGIGTGTGSGTLTFGPNARLVVNNTAGSNTGVSLLKTVTVAGLTLTSGILTTLSNGITVPFNVSTTSDALLTGGSATSFVNGPLTRSTNATTTGQPNIVYPIGAIRNNTTPVYRPLTFSPTQPSIGSYTAQQFEGAPASRAFPASTTNSIKRVSQIRYFTLSAGAGATFNNARVTLSFGPDDRADNASALRIAQGNGAAWVSVEGNTTFTAPATPYATGSVVSTQPFSTLGDFVLASTLSYAQGNNPLPVTLASFTASRQSQNVYVKWATATEKNNAYFEVQRSSDSKVFTSIGKVQGNGTTSMGAAYSFTDRSPLAATAYYRLRQVDTDGTESYSSVVAVAGTDKIEASFYPNPTNSQVTLPAVSGMVKYRIYNATGQNVATGQAVGGSTVDIQHVPMGVYFLELISSDKHNVQRFVKQ